MHILTSKDVHHVSEVSLKPQLSGTCKIDFCAVNGSGNIGPKTGRIFYTHIGLYYAYLILIKLE